MNKRRLLRDSPTLARLVLHSSNELALRDSSFIVLFFIFLLPGDALVLILS